MAAAHTRPIASAETPGGGVHAAVAPPLLFNREASGSSQNAHGAPPASITSMHPAAVAFTEPTQHQGVPRPTLASFGEQDEVHEHEAPKTAFAGQPVVIQHGEGGLDCEHNGGGGGGGAALRLAIPEDCCTVAKAQARWDYWKVHAGPRGCG